MPINFDELRDLEDRDFIIRGETFTIQRVRPEVMDKVNELEEAYIALEDPKYSDVVAIAENRLLLLIDDGNGAVERWTELRAREKDPITYGEIMQISRQAFEKVSGLPTLPPTGSGTGGGRTESSSLVGSS